LRPLVAFREERDVERLFGRGRFLLLAAGVLAKHGALRVNAQPAARTRSNTCVKIPFSSTSAEFTLLVQSVGAIGHGDIAQQAHGDHL